MAHLELTVDNYAVGSLTGSGGVCCELLMVPDQPLNSAWNKLNIGS